MWVVFSTCLGTVELMCECAKCGAFGTVANPRRDEWRASTPRRWDDASRVKIRKPGLGTPVYVRPNPEAN